MRKLLSLCGGTLLFGTAVVAGATAVSWAEPNDYTDRPPQTNSSSALLVEYDAALERFDGTFPDSSRFSDKMLDQRVESFERRAAELGENGGSSGAEPPEVSFEVGYAESDLVSIWRCSWSSAYLTAFKSGDETGVDQARENLSSYHDLEYVKKWVVDPEKVWYKTVVEPAFHGDLKAMSLDVTSNCESDLQ